MAKSSLGKMIAAAYQADKATKSTPTIATAASAPQKEFSQKTGSKKSVKESGSNLTGGSALDDVHAAIDIVSQTAGKEAVKRDAKGDVIVDSAGNPVLIPQLSGFKYMTRDITDLRNLKEQLLKHRKQPLDQSGRMRMLKAMAGEKDMDGYKPPKDAASELAASLQKHQQGILEGNKDFTSAQIAMLGKLIVPPQRVVATEDMSSSSLGSGSAGGGGKTLPKYVFEAKTALSGASQLLKELDKLRGVNDLPGYGKIDNLVTNLKTALGEPSKGAYLRSLIQEAVVMARHQMFGANLTPAEKKSAEDFLADPNNEVAAKMFINSLYRNYEKNKKMYFSSFPENTQGLEDIR